jgi:hypothetical protein
MLGTSSGTRTGRRLAAAAAISLLAGLQASVAPAETATGEARESITTQYERGGRGASTGGAVSEQRYDPLVIAGERVPPSAGSETAKAAGGTEKSTGQDFWFFDADVVLFNDDDRDGYFHGIDVLFDADTYYEFADVYAVLYLSYEGGPWNEVAATDTFRIFGATSDDEYVVVTELMSGYPRGSYDLLIELYDALDGALVAELGPEDHPDFSFLPLEDFNRDNPDRHRHGHSRGGGALDPWTSLLLVMCAVAAWLIRRRQRQFDRDRY